MQKQGNVFLFIDLPNLLEGSTTSFETTCKLLTECVEIAREKGRVLLACAVCDLRHFLPFLDDLGKLALRLGLTLVHTPDMLEGQRIKETVDAKLHELLSLERFLNLEPVTILFVSDDRDFAVDLTGLRNAGHRVETVSRSERPTLLAIFADDANIVGRAGRAVTAAVHGGLHAFVREHWKELLLGLGRAAKSEETFESLTPMESENLLLMVLLIGILADEEKKTGGSLSAREAIQRLLTAPEHLLIGLRGNRAHWLITHLVESRAIMRMEKSIVLSGGHQLIRLVRTEWLPKRREIEVQATAMANPTTIDVAEEPTLDTGDDIAVPANGDGRKRTADEVSDQELFEALRSVFGRLGDKETDYRSGRLEAALVTELHLKGRPEGGRLKMHALRRGLVHKTGAQESSFVFTPPLES